VNNLNIVVLELPIPDLPQKILHSAPKARNVTAWGIAPGKGILMFLSAEGAKSSEGEKRRASIPVVGSYPSHFQHEESRTIYHDCHRTGVASIHGENLQSTKVAIARH
jgi:hypothetical protein